MIRRIWALAVNTYREAIRQKIFYALAMFAAILILSSLFLGQLSLGADTKIVKDVGLASIMLFGAMISIFMGIGLVFKEIERKTIYTVLSKPVSRAEFVLGKFFGLSLTMALMVAGMTVLLYALLSFYAEPLDLDLLKAILLIYIELCVLISAALVFSSYSSQFMSALFSISFLVVGHVSSDLGEIMMPRVMEMIHQGEGSDVYLGEVLRFAIEFVGLLNLDHFAISNRVVHGAPVGMAWVTWSVGYGFFLILLLLMASVFVFSRKDLK